MGAASCNSYHKEYIDKYLRITRGALVKNLLIKSQSLWFYVRVIILGHFIPPLLFEGRHYFFGKQLYRLPGLSHRNTADSVPRTENIHFDQILLFLELSCDRLRATNES